jgi:hypothetical protein
VHNWAEEDNWHLGDAASGRCMMKQAHDQVWQGVDSLVTIVIFKVHKCQHKAKKFNKNIIKTPHYISALLTHY